MVTLKCVRALTEWRPGRPEVTLFEAGQSYPADFCDGCWEVTGADGRARRFLPGEVEQWFALPAGGQPGAAPGGTLGGAPGTALSTALGSSPAEVAQATGAPAGASTPAGTGEGTVDAAAGNAGVPGCEPALAEGADLGDSAALAGGAGRDALAAGTGDCDPGQPAVGAAGRDLDDLPVPSEDADPDELAELEGADLDDSAAEAGDASPEGLAADLDTTDPDDLAADEGGLDLDSLAVDAEDLGAEVDRLDLAADWLALPPEQRRAIDEDPAAHLREAWNLARCSAGVLIRQELTAACAEHAAGLLSGPPVLALFEYGAAPRGEDPRVDFITVLDGEGQRLRLKVGGTSPLHRALTVAARTAELLRVREVRMDDVMPGAGGIQPAEDA